MPHWIEVIIRSAAFLFVLFVVTKVMGKRQISQLSFFEYITGITIGSIAAEVSMSREREVADGLAAVMVWGLIPLAAGYIALKSRSMRKIIEGESTVFIKDGKVLEENLKREKYSTDELLSLLRKKDIFHVADVEFAILEEDGSLNALLKKDKRPLTRQDANLPSMIQKEPESVIMDGRLILSALQLSGKTKEWLDEQLASMNVTIENVFLGQITATGELTVDLYDDQLKVPTIQERPLLLANLKKLEAELEGFALATDCEKAKQMYQESSKELRNIINQTSKYLQ
ncbi:uncharacterized membrane protein YcaP (DUF421 family) [Bacillus ectoiniformans]|uniref:DUF421 domain-containing protein n=1 Tax=Bacillus ectoiniformans TaxID=1494429 RepID=UPI001956FE00|nr:DUF421 domain-containing protein [Bacillus ectoiniformans]MBM7649848.1 uncharacterized membrane protein YcaP (DUF421 family) [Bacillus ectoiniformans]